MPIHLSQHASTHEVLNQAPLLAGHNAYAIDVVLQEALSREGAAWASADVDALGARVGSAEVQAWAHQANANPPVLRSHDRWGNRIDQVEFHPSYHELMHIAFGAGVHSYGWTKARPGAHVARAALSYLWNQAENGVGCPTGMAYAAVPVLAKTGLGDVWNPAINSQHYDPRPVSITEKSGATIGMTLTEKQGGSDLRANLTQARPLAGGTGPGAENGITGHKWF